jgi:PadR family transcriptional regulator AphA
MSLKHAILGFLSYAPMSGYDLKKAFDQNLQHFWPADQSQIYRTLSHLTDEALVEVQVFPRQDRLDRKVYYITETGTDELRRWLSTPLDAAEARKPFLIQLYFGGRVSDDELLVAIEAECQKAEQRLALLTEMHEAVLSRLKGQTKPRGGFLGLLTLEHGIIAYTAHKKWLATVIERIKNRDYTPNTVSELLGS